MTVGQVEEIHQKVIEKNKGKDSQVWAEHYDEMAKKTVVRRLCKHLPSSPELQKAVTLDEKADFGLPQDLGALILPDQEKASDSVEAPPAPKRLSDGAKAPPKITEEQQFELLELRDDQGVKPEGLEQYLKATYGVIGTENILQSDYAAVMAWVKNGPEIPFGK